MKTLTFLLIYSSLSSFANADGKCIGRAKLGPMDWAKEVFESDLETDNQMGSAPISIELGTPILMNKSKNPPKVFEGYSVAWKLKFKDKEWSYTGYYLFDENCQRMKSAENISGKEMEKRAAEKKK